ncbi:Coronin-2B, partial [Clydaea vesicula]
MSRFSNVSKFKNSVLKTHKKEEYYHVEAHNSTDAPPFQATRSLFGLKNQSNNLQIHYLKNTGKNDSQKKNVVSTGNFKDFSFSNFSGNENFPVAIGCDDTTVKCFQISSVEEEIFSSKFLSALTGHRNRVDNVLFNPLTDSVLLSTSENEIIVWDLCKSAIINQFETSANDTIQQLSWNEFGNTFASVGKDNKIRLFDARNNANTLIGDAHSGVKPSRISHLINTYIVTTGFNQRRDREISIWDTRNSFSQPVYTYKIDNSQGVLNPIFDSDTGILFLAGKGDVAVRWFEVNTGSNNFDQTCFTPGTFQFSAPSTYISSALVSKFGLDVMSGEIDRLLLLSSDCKTIYPVSVTVPRKSYIDFHNDIFPDTKSDTTQPLTNSEYLEAKSLSSIPLFSLNPLRKIEKLKNNDLMENKDKNNFAPIQETTVEKLPSKNSEQLFNKKEIVDSLPHTAAQQVPKQPVTKTKPLPRTSLYRFTTGKASLTVRMDDLKGGSGGRIGVWKANAFGRLPPKIPCLINGADVLDFKFNPFEANELITAAEDGKIRLFVLPEDGLKEDLEIPHAIFSAHPAKITSILFHQTIKNLLFSSSPDLGTPCVHMFDISDWKQPIKLRTFSVSDNILSMAVGGKNQSLLATHQKDKSLKVFDICNGKLLQQTLSHEGTKACRLQFLGMETNFLCSVGFSKGSQREIKILDAENLSKIETFSFDTSPSILEPFFDEDTSLLFLSGRGDSIISIFDINLEEFKINFLTRFEGTGPTQ